MKLNETHFSDIKCFQQEHGRRPLITKYGLPNIWVLFLGAIIYWDRFIENILGDK